MKFIKDIFTDDDNDGDMASVLAGIAVVVYLSLTVYTVVWKDQPLNGIDFAAASGALIASYGAAYRLKRNEKNKQ